MNINIKVKKERKVLICLVLNKSYKIQMNNENTNKLKTESIGKLLFGLAVPSITAQLVNMLYNIVDRIYIGHLPEIGPTALTGVGVTMPIILIISAFSSLIGMGGAPRAAIKMGENKNNEAEEILGNCFSSLISISIILTIIFLLFSEKLLLMFGASTETLPYGLSYLKIYVYGTIFVQMSLGLNSFISTQGFAKTSMLTVVIGAVINIVLDPILMFGFNMGVKGAAIATVLSQAVSAVWVLKFLTGNKSKLKIKRKHLKVNKSIMLPVLALGVSPFVMQSTESLLNISFNANLQRYGGDIAVGAMTILSSVMQILFLPISGLTQGAQPIISYNFGAKNSERVKQTFKLLIKTAAIYSVLLWLTILVIPHVFAGIFTSDLELKNYTIWAMRIYFATAFILSLQISCQQTFVAVGQAKISLFLALLRKIILLIPLIYILPYFFEDKVFAVFLAEPVSDFIAASVTVFMFAKNINNILSENEGI